MFKLLIIPIISFSLLCLTPLIVFLLLFYGIKQILRHLFIKKVYVPQTKIKVMSNEIKMPSLKC